MKRGPKLNLIKKIWGTICQAVSNEVNTKMQLSTQCRACGTINISEYVYIFFKHKPYNFYIELSSK